MQLMSMDYDWPAHLLLLYINQKRYLLDTSDCVMTSSFCGVMTKRTKLNLFICLSVEVQQKGKDYIDLNASK